ncbi:MAG: DUF4465 domain-containing protein [Candidatus Limimorpha sp.]
MKKLFLTLLSSLLIIINAGAFAQGMSGTYSDFTSFGSALSALTSAGVSGEVVIEMSPGTYEEFVTIGEINGASQDNRVIFRGIGQDNQQVVLTSNAGYTQNPTVKLDNADFISFENMTIKTTSSNYGNLVVFENNVNHIYFDNVAFIGINVTEQTYNNDKQLVYDHSSTFIDEDIRFTNCSFTNGYIALYLSGQNIYTHDSGLVIENCTFNNQYSKSIYMTFQDNPIVRNNVINNNNDLKNGYQAIDGFRCYSGVVENNVVNIDFNSCYATGIELRPAIGTEDDHFIVRNNMVRINSNASPNYCYDLSDNNGTYVDFAHNTALLNGNGSGTTFFLEDSFTNVNIFNNLLVNNSAGYVFWFKKNNIEGRVCDFNRISMSENCNVGKMETTEYASLNDWISASGFDENTSLCEPSFVSSNDLHISSSEGITINNLLPYVPNDIDGESRNANTCAGADEYNSGQNLPPIVTQNIGNVVFENFPDSVEINIGSTFTDPDDPDENIVVEVVSNSNSSLVSALLNDDILSVTRLLNEEGVATIVLRATSNGQSVETSFTVECRVEDQPPFVANQLEPIVFTSFPQTLEFDLSNAFDDPDNNNAMIVLSLENVPENISAFIDENTLSVTRNTSQAFDNETLVIRASSNGKHVDMFVDVSGLEVVVEMATATFEDVPLNANGIWEPQCGYNTMVSGSWLFTNYYDPTFWGGFTASNHTNINVSGIDAQYTAVTGSGNNGSEKYAVAYTYGSETKVYAADGGEHEVSGCFVTNNLWTYQAVTEGDFMTTPFGGESGNDPDYLYIYAVGRNGENIVTDTVTFYLADFRSDDNSADYVINTWEWFDLSGLGAVSSISFGLESSKYNEWGMLTPAYFCLDDFYVNDTTSVLESVENTVKMYPNPARDFVIIESFYDFDSYKIIDIHGKIVDKNNLSSPRINVADLKSGLYLIVFEGRYGDKTATLIKD